MENRGVLFCTDSVTTGIFTVPTKILFVAATRDTHNTYKLPPAGFEPAAYGLGTSAAMAGDIGATIVSV